MKNVYALIALCCICILISINVFAQNKPYLDSLINQMSSYSKKNATSTIYTHFDKNIYMPGEMVWFTTYVLQPILPLSSYETISIAVVKDDDKQLFYTQENILQNGIAKGSLLLADSLKPGAYSLVVCTNISKKGLPEDVFVQPITIRQASNPDIKIIAKVIDEQNSSDSIKIEIKLFTNNITPIINQIVNYQIGKGTALIAGKVKTDLKGEALLSIKKTILNPDKSLLKLFVAKGYDYRETYLQLPQFLEQLKVSFYPEGGSLLNGFTQTIGIETKDALGATVAVKGGIYEGNTLIEKITTAENGMAQFSLSIENGKQYYFKVDDKQFNTQAKTYLPNSIENGLGLQIKNAVCNDTLDISLFSSTINKNVTLVLHKYQEVFACIDVLMKKNIRKIKFPLSEVPRGILAVTLLDEDKKPWSERLVFANYNQRLQVSIQPNENKIVSRSKAIIKIKITDDKGVPQQGYFSFACVQDNKFDNRKNTDLESYFFVGNHLANGGVGLFDAFAANKQLLGLQLLIKGWRKYKWQQVTETNITDTLQAIEPIYYTVSAKPIQKIGLPNYTLQLFKDENFELIQSNTELFKVPSSLLLTNGKKVMLSIQDKIKANIPFTFNNPYKPIISKWLQTNFSATNDYSFSAFKKQPIVTTAMEESVNQLDEVVVTTYVKCIRPSERNACGDYVCKTLALNCTVHTTCGTPAIDGQKYYMKVGDRYQMAVYNCLGATKPVGTNFLSVQGIKYEKIFYSVDYEIDGKEDEIFISTLFWNGGIVTNGLGEAEISFTTSDLVGKYRCVVNGITANNKFSGYNFFNVVKALNK